MFHDNITERLNGLLGPVLGQYSLEKHIAVCAILLVVFLGLITTIVKMRGQGSRLARECIRDVMIGLLFAVTIIGFPVAIYFIGRAIYRAVSTVPAVAN